MTEGAPRPRVEKPSVGRPRVAIAGAGLMGRWHAHAVARAGGQLVGVCDSSLDAARALAAKAQIPNAETDLTALLERATPDVVHICTPLESHAQLCERALLSGADVIVEKPLAANAAETERLIGLAQEHKCSLYPVHQLLFQPWLAQRERIGEILAIDYNACSAGAIGRGQEGANDVADEILPHPLSLFDRLLAVSGDRPNLAALPWSAERSSAGELRAHATANGVAVSIAISLRGRPPRHELRLTGARGTLHADLFHGFAWLEGETISRGYKIARPFLIAGHQVAGAAVNLARRAARQEPAYPGLRDLMAHVYASPGAASDSPISFVHTLAVARARDAILAAA